MARQPRLQAPDVTLHVIQRGNNRMPCFGHDSDYLLYLAQLRQLAAQCECAVHAYCLMPNHVHLLLTPKREHACSVLMKHIGQRYAQYFNRRHGRTGTLWEGRFRSCVVDSREYVLACYRYIELNPVRAGIAVHPGLYAWSSYTANAGERTDSLIKPHAEYLALASKDPARHVVYRGMLEECLEPELLAAIRAATNGGYPLGSEQFKSGLSLPKGRMLERRRPGRRPRTDEANAIQSGSDPDLF